jgi:hypothetical protein
MPNTLTPSENKLLGQGLLALREMAVMPRLVNRAYETTAGGKGSTVTISVPSPRTAYDIAPSATPPATSDFELTAREIACDKHKGSDFYMTDKDLVSVENQVIPMAASEAIRAIANVVNSDLLNVYKQSYGFTGTPGTAPFTSPSPGIDSAVQARRRLRDQLCPIDNRLTFALDPAAEAAALGLPAFNQVQNSGTNDVIVEGDLGRRFGFNYNVVQDLPYHTAGTGAGYLVNQVGHAVGATTVTVDTGTGTLLDGDLFTVAGSSQQFRVVSLVGATLSYLPKAKTAFADNAAITKVASHQVNLAFHPLAIAFVNKPLQDSDTDGLGSRIGSAVDAISGLVLRLEVSRQNKRTRYEYDILYGYQVIRPEFFCRVLG